MKHEPNLSAKDACHADLQRRILSTDLEPGADLDEARLSTQYGISRTPLREVLQRLSGDGYIDITANRGAKVAPLDLPRLQVFFRTAPFIYSNIAYLAAEHRTDTQIDQLQSHQDAFVAATQVADVEGAALANFYFHDCIGDMAHNPYLRACLDRLLIDHSRMSHSFYRARDEQDTGRITAAAEQHQDMIAAFKARDAEHALTLTQAHWDLSRDRMERFVRPDPLPLTFLDSTEPAHEI